MTGFVLSSDVHLKFDDLLSWTRWADHVEKTLQTLSSNPKTVVILGDLFDFYVYGNSYFENRIQWMRDRFTAWKERGIDVLWYEGNHDLYLPEAHEIFESGGMRFYACHGDRLNPHDHSYLRLKRLLHRREIRLLSRILPGSLLEAIGGRLSHQSRRYWSAQKKWDWRDYKGFLRMQFPSLREQKVSLFVFGHCHWLIDEVVDGMRVINLGFYPDHKRLLTVDEAAIKWHSLDGSEGV